jgi:hypothetical protein
MPTARSVLYWQQGVRCARLAVVCGRQQVNALRRRRGGGRSIAKACFQPNWPRNRGWPEVRRRHLRNVYVSRYSATAQPLRDFYTSCSWPLFIPPRGSDTIPPATKLFRAHSRRAPAESLGTTCSGGRGGWLPEPSLSSSNGTTLRATGQRQTRVRQPGVRQPGARFAWPSRKSQTLKSNSPGSPNELRISAVLVARCAT